MKKYYFLFFFIIIAFFTTQNGVAQNNADANLINKNIEGLSIYPNPVSSGKTFINISSRFNLNKKVEFYNVLGKLIFSINLSDKELNISNLSKGVYILKITENNITETRKLVIK
ncbi:MAG: T9SS type A sorting domain-containing protein [Flaviramulus sp.]|nr:T9SS type A sorting domain-containing protein [Flaviramulus sp.]